MEEGTTHESLNLASHRRLPVLFFCENNLYSSHLALMERRAVDNIADVGAAHGVASVRLDGNDVEEVWHAAAEAVQRARSGGGPTFLECRTYRWRGHVGPSWDLDVGVTRKDELKTWLARDPLARARERLVALGAPAAELDALDRDAAAEVARAEDYAHRSSYPEAEELASHVFFDRQETSR